MKSIAEAIKQRLHHNPNVLARVDSIILVDGLAKNYHRICIGLNQNDEMVVEIVAGNDLKPRLTELFPGATIVEVTLRKEGDDMPYDEDGNPEDMIPVKFLVFPNGMAACCNAAGEQIPKYQGLKDEAIQALKDDGYSWEELSREGS